MKKKASTKKTKSIEDDGADRRRAARTPLKTTVDLKFGKQQKQGTSVNISDTGLCLFSENPLEVELRLDKDGKKVQKKAKIVWAYSQVGGGVTYGFEFL